MKDIEQKEEKLKTLIEELKQRMLVKSAKVRRYQQKLEKFRQRKFFYFEVRRIQWRWSETK